jgi:hypothetical protein
MLEKYAQPYSGPYQPIGCLNANLGLSDVGPASITCVRVHGRPGRMRLRTRVQADGRVGSTLRLNVRSTITPPKRVRSLTGAGNHKPDCCKSVVEGLEGCVRPRARVMTDHSSTLVENRFEEVGSQLPLGASPTLCDTFPHMLVTRTTFFGLVSPQSSRNILKFRPVTPLKRLDGCR